MHFEKWDDIICHTNYTIERKVFKEQAYFVEFYIIIVTHITVDMNMKILKIEYKVGEINTPIVIHNDMDVRVYVIA